MTCKSLLAYCPQAGDVFKALAEPTRRAILDELTERNGQTLLEICVRLATKYQLGSSRQAISQHLDVLEDAGLVRTRREGRYKYHDIDTTPLDHIVDRWRPQASQNSQPSHQPGGHVRIHLSSVFVDDQDKAHDTCGNLLQIAQHD